MKSATLLLDAGNTRLKWALADAHADIFETGVIEYADVAVLFDRLATQIDIKKTAASCVAGTEKEEMICQACMDAGLPKPLFAKVTSSACGLVNDYSALEQLGVDRWVAALGVLQAYKNCNRIVIDAGTAVTVDFVDADNVFQGGVILPGAKLMHDSLVGKAAGIESQLDSGCGQAAMSVLGKNTRECVNAGALFGWAGAVDRVVQELMAIAETSKKPWRVVICGGDALRLNAMLRSAVDVSHQPDLIFMGLLSMLRSGELV